jgi:hypothetical protein
MGINQPTSKPLLTKGPWHYRVQALRLPWQGAGTPLLHSALAYVSARPHSLAAYGLGIRHSAEGWGLAESIHAVAIHGSQAATQG